MTETGGFILKTILYEGCPAKPRDVIVFEKQLAKNDFVVIHPDSLNTYAATGGLPVGETITSMDGDLIVGKILTVPKFESLVYNPSIVEWGEQLATKHYRTADVIWYGVNSITIAHLQAGSILPGDETLGSDSVETDKRVDGKLALIPGVGHGIVSFHAGSSGDDIMIGIMGKVSVETFS